MKKLFFLALVAIAGWYGWKHYPELLHRAPSNEALLKNESGHPLERVRITVAGQTYVIERLETGQSRGVSFPAVTAPSEFQLTWEYGDAQGEHRWNGGGISPSPLPDRHTFLIDPEGEVMYSAAKK